MKQLILLFTSVLPELCLSLRQYQDRIPNGDFTGLFQSRSFGHYKPTTTLGIKDIFLEVNDFALDFKDAGLKWTTEFCDLDSDGDGIPNGVELGDPDCIFLDNASAIGPIRSHPGDPESTPDSPKFSQFQGRDLDLYVLSLHVVLMCLAWGVLIPLGIFIAMTQRMFPGSSWETHHGLILTLALFFIAVAVVVMSILGFGPKLVLHSFHAQLGFGLTGVLSADYLLGIIRPKSRSNFRDTEDEGVVLCCWSLLHTSLGRTSVIFSALVIITGLRTGFPELLDYMPLGFLAAAVGGAYVAGIIIAIIFSWLNWRKRAAMQNRRRGMSSESAQKYHKSGRDLVRDVALTQRKQQQARLEYDSDEDVERTPVLRVEDIMGGRTKRYSFERSRMKRLSQDKWMPPPKQRSDNASNESDFDSRI